MTRKEGETVDEYLIRREKIKEKERAERESEYLADEKRREAEHIARLQNEWPGRKVTAEGVHLKCPICSKKFIKRYPETELCKKCEERQEIEEDWPTHKISKKNEVEFVCKECGKLFWYYFTFHSSGRKPDFCSDYCKWVAGLKRAPIWTREEWDKIEAAKKQESDKENYGSGWASFFSGNFKQASKEYDLSNPQQDANQKQLFYAIEEYFEEYEEPNRRLEAIHNLVRKLKSVANECHVEIHNSDESDEFEQKEIEAAG